MRRCSYLIVITIFFWIFPCTTFAAQKANAQTQVLNEQKLLSLFTEIIYQNIPGTIEEVQVSGFASQPRSIIIPQGEISYKTSSPLPEVSPGKKFIAVIICVNGREQETVRMHGDLHFWSTVVTAAQPLRRNQIIDADDIQSDFRDISMLGQDIISQADLALGKKLKKSLRAGAVLHADFLENPPLVHRGDLVTILAKNHSLQVTAPGEAKNAGAKGEIVRVKNLMSRRILQARVIGEGLVEVDL